MAELDLLRLPDVPGPEDDADTPRTVAEVRDQLNRHHSVILPDEAPFSGEAARSFGFTRRVSVSDAVEWLATNSVFITARAADRDAGLARCRAALLSRTGGAEMIEMPMRSWCWRVDRVDRSLPKATVNN